MRRENAQVFLIFRVILILAAFGLLTGGSLVVSADTTNEPLFAPAAAVTVSAGAPQLGENFDITLTFDNTDPTDTGYGPFIDLYVPHTGADGSTPPFDGISPPPPASQYTASYNGSSLTTYTLEFPDDGSGFGCVNHPLALDEFGFFVEVCGIAGDQLVVIQLPFGSFTPEQPEVTVIVPAHLSDLANVGEPLSLYARGGFQYGATPTIDWCCTFPVDTTIFSDDGPPDTWVASEAVIPTLITIDKSDSDILPTGPNYEETFTITVDIADGQTVTDVVITDVLPTELVYMDTLNINPAPTSFEEPSALNGFTLTVNYASVVGGPGDDITISYDFYVDDVLTSTTGAIETIENEVFLTGTWEPIDPRNLPGPISIGPGIGVINAAPLEFEKSNSIFSDPGGNGLSENDVVEHTVTMFVSDHFALGNLLITADVISDGHHFYAPAGFEPQLTVDTDGASTTVDFSTANYSVTCNYTGGPGTECDLNDPAANDGTSTLTFDVSQQIIDSSIQGAGQLIGDLVDDGDFLNDQATAFTITYYTQVLDSYTDIVGEDSLNHGDEISNTANYSALLLDTTTCTSGSCTANHGVTLSGSATASLEVEAPTASKGIVAIEGVTCGTPAFSECTDVSASPGETVTYRVTYHLNTGDYENLILTDYLPLPIMQVDDPNADGSVGPAWSQYAGANSTPDTGTWMRMIPGDTQFAAQGVDPSVSIDATNNTLIFNFGTYADPNNLPLTIDLLFTITVSSDPYADGLLMTNQLFQSDSDTTGAPNSSTEIGQLTLSEPVLVSNKTAVSTNNVNIPFATPPPITFDLPGIVPDLDAPWTGGTINSDYLGANNGNLNIDISGVDGGDLVKFAIVIQNVGSSPNGAYDIIIKDTLPAGFITPGLGADPDGINLQVYRGDGVALNYVTVGTGGLLGDGIQILDPANDPFWPPADPDYGKGACQGHDATNGKNVIIITYDFLVDPFVNAGQVILNEGEVIQFAGSEGGPNHLEEPLQDSAQTTIASPGLEKGVIGSEIDLGPGSSNLGTEAVIGELVYFQVEVTVPEGQMQDFVIEDTFIDGGVPYFAFVSMDGFTVSDVDTDGNQLDTTDTGILFTGSSTPVVTDNGATITINLGTVYNTDTDNAVAETITVDYTVVVLNIIENQMPSTITNFAFLQWTSLDSNGNPVPRQVGPVSASVDVIEPVLNIRKNVTNITKGVAGDYDAGDLIEYTIEIEHLGGSTDAFEVELLDPLPNGLGNTVITGAVITGVTDTSTVNPVDATFFELVCADPGCVAPDFDTLQTVAPFDWPADTAGLITITLQGVLASSLGPSDLVRNDAVIFWSSLDGSVSDRSGDYTGDGDRERDGSGGSLDNYRDLARSDLNINDAGAIKYLYATDAGHTSGADLAIGEIATFVIVVGMPEGLTSDLVVIDLTPLGMQYISGSGVLHTTVADSLGYLAEDFAGTIAAPTITTAGGSGDSVSFDFDSIMVTVDNNVNNNAFVIELDAVLLNEAGNQTENPTITNDVETVADGVTIAGSGVDLEIVEPQLLLTKTVDDDTPILGQTLTFTLTLEHTAASDADAFNVQVTDLIPAGLDYVASSITTPAGWTSSDVGNPTLTWNGDLSLATGSVSMSYQAVVNAVTNNPGDTLTNNAVATWASLDTDAANDGTSEERTGPTGGGDTLNDYESTSSVTATVTNIDLEVSKDDGGVTGVPNSDVTYTITVTNSGSDTATNIVITETVPDYTTFNPAASPAGWVCSAGGVAGDTCTFGVALLAGGDVGTVDFVVTLDAVIPIGVTSTTNNVSVADDGTHGPDQTPENNSASDDTPLLAAPDIAITKTDGMTAVSPGTTTTYTLTISNLGDQDGLGVEVTDTIPDNTSFVSASQNPDGLDAVYDDPTRTVTWPVFDLAAGASEIVTVTVLVDSPYSGGPTITNTAHAEDDGTNGTDTNLQNNDAEDINNVLTLLSKTIIATSEGSTPTELTGDENVTIGEILTYQLIFDLPAGANMDALTLTDTLGMGLAFVDCLSVTATSGSVTTDVSGAPSSDFTPVCAGVAVNDIVNPTDPTNPIGLGREVVFDFGNVVNGGAVDAQIVVQYRAVVLEVVENQAGYILENTVEMGWGGGDLTTTNAEQAIIVEPDLDLEKSVDPQTVSASGGTVTYTIRIGHTADSTSDAFNLLIEDEVPAGLTYVPGSLQSVSGVLPTVLNDTSLPNLEIEWDTLPLGNEAVIEFQAEFSSLPGGAEVVNIASLIWSSLPGDQTAPSSSSNDRSVERVYNPDVLDWFGGVSDDAVFSTAGLPATGFPAGVVTDIPQQPDNLTYTAADGLTLEIDKLGVNTSIMGIPLQNGEWNLTWLWNQVGYLDGTAYPTWSGNTALTAHVFLPNGEPGPFVDLNTLVWGDEIIINSRGLEYVYEVRTVQRVWPDDVSVLRHEVYPWLTLITCQGFNQQTGEYLFRTAVRAVLVAVR